MARPGQLLALLGKEKRTTWLIGGTPLLCDLVLAICAFSLEVPFVLEPFEGVAVGRNRDPTWKWIETLRRQFMAEICTSYNGEWLHSQTWGANSVEGGRCAW